MSNPLTPNQKRLTREWAHQKTLCKDIYVNGVALGDVLISLLDEIEHLDNEVFKLHNSLVDEAILVNSWMHKHDKLLGRIHKHLEWVSQLLMEIIAK